MMELLTAGASGLGIELDTAQIDRFQRYYDELVAWNESINLTGVTGYEQVQTRHFLDSLMVASEIPQIVLDGSGKLLDLGSGAGFPGLPLKIAYPELNMTLLEATAKKTAFLSHLVETLGLVGVKVVTSRAEVEAHGPGMREEFDIVASRAVARLNVLVELCLPFCTVGGGLMIAQKGRDVDMELHQARTAIDTLGGRVKDSKADTQATEGSTLIVIMKERPTPSNYPRRPGMPAKRPM